MRIKKRELRDMKTAVKEGPDRSTLFWFMVRHYADLVDQEHTGRMPWKDLCPRFVAQGLTDGHGKAPTPARACRTWREAKVEAKAQAERTSTVGKTVRSRQQAGWQPHSAPVQPAPAYVSTHRPYSHPDDGKLPAPVQQQPERSAQAQLSAQRAGARSPQATPDLSTLSEHAREQFAKLDALFAETDRKRFGRFR